MNRKTRIAGINTGFSLIELLMVLAVIAILATIAAPNLTVWRERMKLKATARELYSNMQNARMSAVKNNSTEWIAFNVDTNSYTLSNGNVVNLKNGVCYGHGGVSSPVGTSFGVDNVTYQTNTVKFDARGTGNAGYVYLTLINDSNRVYAVGGPPSGIIKLLRWMGSEWK